MHEEHTIHPNSTIVVLSNVSITNATTTNADNKMTINRNGGTERNNITNATNQIESIFSDSVKLNLDAIDNNPNTATQYFFSTTTPNQLQTNNNNNTILIDDSNQNQIIVCNDDATITVTSFAAYENKVNFQISIILYMSKRAYISHCQLTLRIYVITISFQSRQRASMIVAEVIPLTIIMLAMMTQKTMEIIRY